MDQNSTNGTDKRSWRERLGIGAGGGGKDMPRISDEFAAASPAQKASVKPAPMAPRANAKMAPPRNAENAPSSEKLADKLKAQRDAQERLAEQRVQAAKNRAEIKSPENGSSNGSKPKFAFAVEDPPAIVAPKPAAPPPSPPQPSSRGTTPVPPMPQARPTTTPQPQMSRPLAPPPALNTPALTPPRQPLGADRPTMPARSPLQPPATPPRAQQRYAPPPVPGYNPAGNSYAAQTPQYRPIEPGNRGYSSGGYSPPPAYTPPVGGYNNQPRLTVPPARGVGYAPEAIDPRARHLRPPARPSVGYREDYAENDIFDDQRAPRRATAGEYSQAYRDAEHGFDEDLPPSRGPWLPLLLLLALALLAGGAVWYLYTSGTGNLKAGSGADAPVVSAPAQPAKVVPEPTTQPTNAPTKKLIYDRIVGDQEVLGGDVIQSEEVPAQPGDSTNLQDGDPAQGVSDPAQPTGQEDLVPLPLPPPPGEDGAGDQQGAAPPLDPGGKTSNQAMVSSAASESQAAVLSQETVIGAAQKSDASVAKSDPPSAAAEIAAVNPDLMPVPGEALPVPGETASTSETETIQDATAQPAEPVASPKKKVVTELKPKKAPTKKTAQKSLGAKPLVLVPPADVAAVDSDAAFEQDVATIDDGTSTGGGLYSGEGVQEPGTVAAAPTPTPIKKKRTLADLFRSDANEAAPESETAISETAPTPQPAPAPIKKPVAQPTQQVASAGGYVVQLASFPNQGDASKEFSRLRSKHSAALSGLSPVVTQATVGGSKRFRLAAGTMATREQASAVCAKLFAAGERDCLVRRQ